MNSAAFGMDINQASMMAQSVWEPRDSYDERPRPAHMCMVQTKEASLKDVGMDKASESHFMASGKRGSEDAAHSLRSSVKACKSYEDGIGLHVHLNSFSKRLDASQAPVKG